MKTTHTEKLSEVYIDYHKGLKEDKYELLKILDNLIVWPVSLSTGAIALIFTGKGNLVFSKYCLILFVFSITFGLLARLTNMWAIRLYNIMEAEFTIHCKMLCFPHSNDLLRGDETAREVYYLLQETFKIDEPNIIRDYDIVSEEHKELMDVSARAFYNKYVEYSKVEFDIAVENLDNIMIKCFGLKENYFIKRREKKANNIVRRRLAKVSNFSGKLLCYVSIGCFIGSLLIMLLGYINN